ncbi:MAG TPA: IS4 family transposase [Tepidisphaeraceae bacterium]|jgi:IS4 transposase
MNQGRNVFAQLVEFLPRRAFENAVSRYRGNRRVRSLSCMDQLLAMIFAQLTGRSSLRETVSCLRALGTRRYHCGIRGTIARSTLAEANEYRDYRIYMDTALAMIAAARIELPVDRELARLDAQAYALDSTTIDLCLKLFPWARFRRRKAGIKAHTLLDLKAGIPVFLRVTHAKTHDLWALDQIVPEPGAFYVFDKAYVDFARLHRLHCAGAFFVTRAKKNMDFTVRQRQAVDAAAGVKADRLIRLAGIKPRRLYPDTLRQIRFVDPQTGKRLKFLTNNLTLEASSIALLYHKRWKIELFFKWVKQHLHIKAFFGNTPNAVKTQLWAAVIVYVLVMRLKHRYQLPQEANEIFQILSVTILEKVPVFELFSEIKQNSAEDQNSNQLSLFD